MGDRDNKHTSGARAEACRAPKISTLIVDPDKVRAPVSPDRPVLATCRGVLEMGPQMCRDTDSRRSEHVCHVWTSCEGSRISGKILKREKRGIPSLATHKLKDV